MAKDLKFKLLTGDNIPLIGFGTYLVSGRKCKDVIDAALAAGYRLFDTAKMYGNEEELGQAFKELLPKHNLTRKDIFITTKLYPSDQGEKAYAALKHSLHKLDCEYIDLYLIHWPGTYGVDSKKEAAGLRDLSWQQLVKGVKDGLTKNIGVSNYTVKHMKELLANDHGIKPAVNQIEWHPYCHPKDIYTLCKENGILIQAYMPLGSGNKSLINDSTIVRIAEKLKKTPAQVILRWSIQQNVAIIPKASSKSHMEENIDLNFELPDEDVEAINSIKKSEKYDWDPEGV